ncbi:MAG TPA: histidinol dehydrogenase, partial [Syntrophomonas sp.]|nr:histidinol dehydrogenase [Syntrophomonas sp.]
MLAGPSEILIIADQQADPAYVAADLMSQAEHDVLARSILVTPDAALLDKVESELERQVMKLSRRDMILEALERNGAFIITHDIQ